MHTVMHFPFQNCPNINFSFSVLTQTTSGVLIVLVPQSTARPFLRSKRWQRRSSYLEGHEPAARRGRVNNLQVDRALYASRFMLLPRHCHPSSGCSEPWQFLRLIPSGGTFNFDRDHVRQTVRNTVDFHLPFPRRTD